LSVKEKLRIIIDNEKDKEEKGKGESKGDLKQRKLKMEEP